MNETNAFDWGLARAYCMEYGVAVGVLCSVSFLCSMYGVGSALLAQMSNVLALAAVYVAGLLLRGFGRNVAATGGLGRTCRMALLTYLFACLLTALVQYFYFAFFDGGRLAAQVEQLLTLPEYRQWLAQFAPGGDVDALLKEVGRTMGNPAAITFQLMWLNLLVSLVVTLPTAWIARYGKTKKLSPLGDKRQKTKDESPKL